MPDGRLSAFGRTVRPVAFPIGLDAVEFTEMLASETAQQSYQRMEESKLGRRMVLGVDRLDYSKGLEERLLAYERFLTDHPDRRRRGGAG